MAGKEALPVPEGWTISAPVPAGDEWECWWCEGGLDSRGLIIWLNQGDSDDPYPVHDNGRCIEECKRRHVIGGALKELEKLVEAFTDMQAALDTEVERAPTEPGSQYYYDRDDAGVEVARAVPGLLALLRAEGTYNA